jgi:RNase P protein component
LARATEIELVKRTGKRMKTGVLDARVAASPSSRAQVGVIVPKYRRTIVERNRLRRRLRELARVRLLPLLDATVETRGARAMLIRALPTAYSASFDGLARDIDAIVARLG